MRYFHGSLKLDVPDGVYYPREDSELLASCLDKIDLKEKKFLEIGCGSGLISIIAAKAGAITTGVDINLLAVTTTRDNARMNGANVHALESDLFQNLAGKFEIIVFNAPYLPVEESDATYSGGLTGREAIEKFVPQARDHLERNGMILLLISSLTGEQEVLQLFKDHGMKASIAAREKIPWEELLIVRAVLI